MKGATMRRLRILLVLVGFIAMTSGPVFAQTVGATTGAINGKVSDATGGVMPGVTITIGSPSMQGIRVGLGFTATVNIELKVAALAESVTVSGASPVVDITSTKTATNFDAKEL